MKSATVLANESISSAIECEDTQFVLIKFPSNFTQCNVSFLGSFDNVNYCPVYDNNGVQISMQNCAPDTIRQLGVIWSGGLASIKLQFSVQQQQDVTIQLS